LPVHLYPFSFGLDAAQQPALIFPSTFPKEKAGSLIDEHIILSLLLTSFFVCLEISGNKKYEILLQVERNNLFLYSK
jgi:hypothetical protein